MRSLIATNTIQEATRICWDLRPSERYPTLEFVRPVLEEFGEWDKVYAIARETMQQGNGAARQRNVYKRSGSLEDVVDFIVRETAKGTMTV
ncbi:MAG: hypothetical protein AB1589_12260 [Cyanobacteriota bacterium]